MNSINDCTGEGERAQFAVNIRYVVLGLKAAHLDLLNEGQRFFGVV